MELERAKVNDLKGKTHTQREIERLELSNSELKQQLKQAKRVYLDESQKRKELEDWFVEKVAIEF